MYLSPYKNILDGVAPSTTALYRAGLHLLQGLYFALSMFLYGAPGGSRTLKIGIFSVFESKLYQLYKYIYEYINTKKQTLTYSHLQNTS